MAKRLCEDVLLVPTPMAGHMNPMMYFVKQLMEKGISMTMLLSEDKKSALEGHQDAINMERFHVHWLKSPERGGAPPFPGPDGAGGRGQPGGGGRGGGGPRGGGGGGRGPGGRGGKNSFEPFLQQLLEAKQAGHGEDGPKCIIADQFMGWSLNWAEKLQIPGFVSIVSPATFGYCMYNHSMLIERDHLLDRVDEDPIISLPGIPVVHLKDLSGMATNANSSMSESGVTFRLASGFLFNTFYDLESSPIDAFDKQVKEERGEKASKMLPIGPMLPAEYFEDHSFEGTQPDNECIKWLNTQSPSSVIYIAFGSAAYLSETQIPEVAKALEASKAQFLWILRQRSSPRHAAKSLEEILPEGFLERTKDQGLVYSEFAPQLQILSHQATGGFLSHCGWNSSLESMCRGVPIAGWPMSAEQKLCCRVLEHSGVAVAVRPERLTDSRDLVEAHELENAFRILMIDPEGDKLREKAKQMQICARKAMSPGGSSVQSLDYLAHTILDKKS